MEVKALLFWARYKPPNKKKNRMSYGAIAFVWASFETHQGTFNTTYKADRPLGVFYFTTESNKDWGSKTEGKKKTKILVQAPISPGCNFFCKSRPLWELSKFLINEIKSLSIPRGGGRDGAISAL